MSEISNDGVILSDSLYGDKHRYLRVSNCRTVEDDGIIVSGSVWNLTPNDMGYLLRISNDGDSLWYRQFAILYGQDSKNYFYDAIPVSDKGFLACGGCVPVAPDTGTQDAWVIKVDSLGCESPTYCWVGEEELEMPTSDQYLIIYPNPAWDKFTVSSQQSAVSNWQIAVYDMFGRKVEEIQVSKGKTKIVVNSMGWKKGLYIIRTMNKNGLIGSGKVIVK